ncbi:hypothetical protein LWI28_002402 [Acer negundo]|uniref:Pectinesterase n=1 Tax=Acer negundo TaxID=4023 RepID=A0AAD5IF73_ACENE|nr:hypothetical protein LWI28_002402 [Acer negundo]
MELKLGFFLLFISFFICFSSSPAFSTSVSTGGIDYWCNRTPNPKTCKYMLEQQNHHYKSRSFLQPKSKTEFKKMALELAMEHALTAQSHNKWLGSKCRNNKEKAAWTDCLKLYQDTIVQLNQTLDPTIKCTDFDAQTWLSTALTNMETCRDGNILALNNNASSSSLTTSFKVPETNYRDGFPRWVKPGDRKLLQTLSISPDLVVAQDGSGDFRTVNAAIDAAAKRSGSRRFVILVKRGVYEENVDIKLKNITLVGDGLRFTIITGNRSVGGNSTTFNSATVAVTGEGFIARGITFRNTAGPQNHQAVALRSGSDLSVFYRCGFEGYQDTLYIHSQRQFYRECYIYGTVDFIFGNAAAVLQNCMIYARRPMDQQKNTVTAQGRTDPNQNTGISIHNSRVMAAPDLTPVLSSFKTFLGRPWKEYSRTVFMQSYLDTLVDPAGWLEWDGNFALNTLYYGEYRNIGPASSTGGRVKWQGYRVITSATEASNFTVANFIAGRSWLPATGVPFTSGL